MFSNISNKWHGGKLLAFSGLDGQTDYSNGLTGRTSTQKIAIELKLPGEAEILLSEKTPCEAFISGDCFKVITDDNSLIDGAFIDCHHLLIQGICKLSVNSEKIAYIQKDNKILIGSQTHFRPNLINRDICKITKARLSWVNQQTVPQEAPRALYAALHLMKSQVYSSEGKLQRRWTTPDRWPHQKMWLWDSVFHAVGWRHLNSQLAREAILSVIDCQQSDGFIPHMMAPDYASDTTQPPILALGIKLMHELHPSENLIAETYPKLCRYIEWDLNNRDSDGEGLMEWFIEGTPECRCGESGMDNSPRFDSATQLDAVDFNSFLALECEILAEFAELLNLPKEVKQWENRANQLRAKINQRLWNETEGFYFDHDVTTGQSSKVMASSGFLPLLCGAPSPDQAAKLVEHLKNPKTFNAAFPVPSIAVKDTNNYSKDMWRGPTWININWLIARGLERYGYNHEAQSIVDKTVAVIEDNYEKFGTFFEFYDDRLDHTPPELLRKGKCDPESAYHQVFHDYGWTATLYVDMILSRN